MTIAMDDEEVPARAAPKSGGHTTVSAMFKHCRQVYEAMYEESKTYWADSGRGDPTPMAVSEHPEPPYEGAVQIRVWEGFLTKLVNTRLQFSTPYFSHVRSNLIALGCMRQLQRGGGSSPSRWELMGEPDLEKFEEIKKASGSSYGAVGRSLRGIPTHKDAPPVRVPVKDVSEIRATLTLQVSVVNAILTALQEHGIEVNLDDIGPESATS